MENREDKGGDVAEAVIGRVQVLGAGVAPSTVVTGGE